MAKIAVYDKFFETNSEKDIITPTLAVTSHQVVGKAYDLCEAVGQILRFINGNPEGRPGIVIMSGRLRGEEEYKKHPTTVTEPCTVKRRRWYGTQKVEAVRTTFLLPRFGPRSDVYDFPSVTGDHPRLPHDVVRQWGDLNIALAGPLLSRMVHTYLPETVRIGVSDNRMYDSVLHQVVLRNDADATHQMYGHIQYYAPPDGANHDLHQ